MLVRVTVPRGICFGSIGDVFLICFGVLFNLRIFSIALSTLGIDNLDLNVVGISGLSCDVIMKSYLLLEVYTLIGLLWVESGVSVFTSTVGDSANSLSSICRNDVFCRACFSMWSFVCSRAAARDFVKIDSFCLLNDFFLLLCFGFDSFGCIV